MKKKHLKVRHSIKHIVLTEEEARALESDKSKWPSNWTVLLFSRKTR